MRRPLALLVLLSFATAASAEPLLKPGDRVVICGDGQVNQLGFVVNIGDYLAACQPISGVEFSQFGWRASTAEQFLPHLETDVLPYHPTVALIAFGMFDGDFQAPDAAVADRYRRAQTELVRALKKAGMRTVVIGSPRCLDPATFKNDRIDAATYNKTLAALAEIDRQVASDEKAVYADVYGTTTSAMQKLKAAVGQDCPYDAEQNFAPDDRSGLVTAYAYLKALGCTGSIGTITADFAASTATADDAQTVISFHDYELTVESRRYPFCYPPYPSGKPAGDPILKAVPFDNELNRYLLVVKNLPAANAKIYWRGNEQHNFSADELARGANLAGAFSDRPFCGPLQDVDNAVRDQVQQEGRLGALAVQKQPLDAVLLANRDLVRRRQRERFVPVKHTLRIQPLAPPQKHPAGPVPVIVDTDMSSDCDDAGALALVNTFMNQGEAELLACVVDVRDRDQSSGAACQAINAWYGHPNVPIGACHGPTPDGGSHYTKKIHERFCPDFPNDDKLPAGVDVYRQALAGAADGRVVIVSLGVLRNLDDLLKSGPDSVSPLSGIDLVRKKVRQIVIMNNQQKEDEFVVTHWPTPIIWTMDVGTTIYTGKSLAATPENNPVRVIYNLFGDEQHNALRDARQSWDLTASWLAVRGAEPLWDISAGGYWKVDTQNGGGQWINSSPNGQGLALPRMPSAEVGKLLDAELARLPK